MSYPNVNVLMTHLTDELAALQECGVNAPERAFQMAKDDMIVKEYLTSDLGISELADLFCDLAVI